MRTICKTVFSFDELTKEAQQTAIEKVRNRNYAQPYFWAGEALGSIKKGLAAFSCGLKDYSLQWDNPNQSSHKIGYPENAEELTGLRLRTWLIHNADTGTFTAPKHYGRYFYPDGSKKGRYQRYSRIFKMQSSCPFTGVCYDESFLDPIRKFMDHPTPGTTLADLMEDAILSVLRDVESEIDYQNSDEGIKEEIQANDYEFYENGKIA